MCILNHCVMKTSSIMKYAVGIDVAKKDFKCCISTIDASQQVEVKATSHFECNLRGYEAFFKWVGRHHKTEEPIVYCMEATGIYHEYLALFLHDRGCYVSVVLPTLSKRYLQSSGNKSKNDKIDAVGLAQMAAEKALSSWQPFSKDIYTLRQMTRLIEDLNQQRTSLRNQLHALKHSMYEMSELEAALKDVLVVVEGKIKELKKKVETTIKADEKLWPRFQNLLSIKGVGTYTLAVIVAETNGFELFDNIAQLTSYAGYDVVQNQSGQYKGRSRISKRGNSHIRRALHMPSLNMVRYRVPTLYPLYERVVDRTKMKMKGIVAVQRKLLGIIYTLWKRQEIFDPHKMKVATQMVATLDELHV